MRINENKIETLHQEGKNGRGIPSLGSHTEAQGTTSSPSISVEKSEGTRDSEVPSPAQSLWDVLFPPTPKAEAEAELQPSCPRPSVCTLSGHQPPPEQGEGLNSVPTGSPRESTNICPEEGGQEDCWLGEPWGVHPSKGRMWYPLDLQKLFTFLKM